MNTAILVSDVSDDSRKKKDFIEKIDNKITKTNLKFPYRYLYKEKLWRSCQH